LVDLGIVAAVVFAFGLVSRRFQGTIITAPMVFVGTGLVAYWAGLLDFGFVEEGGLGEFEIGNELILVFAEVALALVLFTDASRIDLRALPGNAELPARMLGIGMPLTIALGTGVAVLLLTDLAIWEAAIVATVLAPTDAALGQAVVSNQRLPVRIRQALNVESGLNDGLSVPFLMIFIALAGAEEAIEPASFWIRFGLEQIGFGVLTGIVVGLVGGWLIDQASVRGWMTGVFQQLGIAALAVMAWASADQIGGNGFIAAFVGGLAVGWIVTDCGEKVFAFTEEEGQLLNLSIFFIFGVLAAQILAYVTWQMALFAVMSLSVIRMVPVAISLIGTHLRSTTVAFLGWFGPRGLASIVLALVVLADESELSGRGEIFLVMVATVLLSVFAHGVTAAPLSDIYARRGAELGEDAPEMKEVVEIPTRTSYAR
jgi:NhaP-type Na+/H+ or K+/H+ antiporter